MLLLDGAEGDGRGQKAKEEGGTGNHGLMIIRGNGPLYCVRVKILWHNLQSKPPETPQKMPNFRQFGGFAPVELNTRVRTSRMHTMHTVYA